MTSPVECWLVTVLMMDAGRHMPDAHGGDGKQMDDFTVVMDDFTRLLKSLV